MPAFQHGQMRPCFFCLLAATVAISAWALLNIIISKQKTDQDKTPIRRETTQAE
jgi:hypothetical protein